MLRLCLFSSSQAYSLEGWECLSQEMYFKGTVHYITSHAECSVRTGGCLEAIAWSFAKDVALIIVVRVLGLGGLTINPPLTQEAHWATLACLSVSIRMQEWL